MLILKQFLADPPQKPKEPGNGQGKKNPKADKGNQEKSTNKPQPQNDQPGQQPINGSAEAIPTPGDSLQELLTTAGTELPDDIGTLLAESLSATKPERGDKLQVAVCTGKQKAPFPPLTLDGARKATTALRTRLRALLQSQIQTLSRTGYKGKLDTQKLHRLFTGNPRIFRKRGEKQGTDTAVHILLDVSGSMSGPATTLAGQACFAVSSALHAIPGVNMAVTAFPGDPAWEPDGKRSWKTVAPILKHGERLHGEFSFASNGDTPLGEALWWTMQQMQLLTEPRKIILVITDGHPDSKLLAQNAIRTAQAIGYEVYGIGIGERTGIHDLLPTSSMTILTLPELASAMFSILSKSLLNMHPEPKAITNKN